MMGGWGMGLNESGRDGESPKVSNIDKWMDDFALRGSIRKASVG